MLQEINETSGRPITWASISNGLIVVRSTEADPKAKSRVNKLGNTVWERFYRSIYGVITNISVEENKFGEKDIRVGLKHGDMIGVLTIKLDSSYGRSFFAQIFNTDLSRGIEFTPWSKVTEDGTKKTRLYLGYGKREPVEWKLPEGTPVVKFVEIKGKKVVDNISQIEQMDFLEEKLNAFIKAHGLEYVKSQSEEEFLGGDVDTTPLTDGEKKKLSKPKTTNPAKGYIIEEGSEDDLFDNI